MKTGTFWQKLSLPPLSTFAVMGLMAATVAITWLGNGINQMALMQEGLQTCFNRVSQSHTAKLIQAKDSFYLDATFHQTTEECFGEVMTAYEKQSQQALVKVGPLLNQLMNDVHWFHQKLNMEPTIGPGGNSQNVLIANTNGRFEKLETAINEISDQIDANKTKHLDGMHVAKLCFYGFVLLAPFFMLRDYLRIRRNREELLQVEEQAEQLLTSYQHQATEGVLQQALTLGGVDNCSRLFTMYKNRLGHEQASVRETKSESKRTDTVAGAVQHLTGLEDSEAIIEKLDHAWDADLVEANTSNDSTSCASSDAISMALDHASSKLFTTGVKLDCHEENNPNIKGEKEKVGQIVYNCLVDAINHSAKVNGNLTVSLKQKQLGKTVVIDIDSDTNGEQTEAQDSIDLMIAKELISDLEGGRIEIKANKADQSRKLRLIFTHEPAKKAGKGRQLVALKKGKKRDFMTQA